MDFSGSAVRAASEAEVSADSAVQADLEEAQTVPLAGAADFREAAAPLGAAARVTDFNSSQTPAVFILNIKTENTDVGAFKRQGLRRLF